MHPEPGLSGLTRTLTKKVIEGVENQYPAYHVIEGSGISAARETMVAEALEL